MEKTKYWIGLETSEGWNSGKNYIEANSEEEAKQIALQMVTHRDFDVFEWNQSGYMNVDEESIIVYRIDEEREKVGDCL